MPDTTRVWEKLRASLQRGDVVALSLPGFGTPVPPGFVPTKEAYAEWLIDELKRIDGPVDIVGHDWGSMLAVRAVSLEPALFRSWVAGGAPVDPEYVWHDMARMWQTPGVGEQVMKAMTPDALAAGLAAAGVPADDAAETAKHVDDTMKSCILGLYRSAIRAGEEWSPALSAITAPGLVLWGEKDPYAPPEFGQRLADHTRTQFVSFPDCGHWWQVQRPNEAAVAMRELWNSLD